MGRHAGYLTAASSAARRFSDDGPHLIYVPERAFSIDKFLKDVKSVYDRLGRCIVAVSEGIQDANGTPVLASLMDLATDDHGNVQLSGTGALGELLANEVKDKLKIGRVRSDTFGYLQRSFMGCVSDVDQREAREVGERAVQFAMNGATEGSVTINRVGNYAVDYKLNPIEDIAAKTKLMPDEFINAEGNHVTPAFEDYLRPLLGSNMPEAARLRAPRAEKLN
jgi:6-phosphofructokinase 1